MAEDIREQVMGEAIHREALVEVIHNNPSVIINSEVHRLVDSMALKMGLDLISEAVE